MIPETTREALLKAMEHFDQELRNTITWVNWEQKRNYKYAIEHNGLRYPAKDIISLATGVTKNTFDGGHKEANKYLINKGFSIVNLRTNADEFIGDEMKELIEAITSFGFVFQPWQIAAYVAALQTKPFIILAGVSGTGKSKLPALVARSTGGEVRLLPVRPDWTDSSDVLGYADLQGNFRPGPLLELAREAAENQDKHYVCIIDEMNLSRVEHYFAEVLSRIEDRRPEPYGGYASGPLLSQRLREADAIWARQGLPANLALVGTVNMDESTHGFSRKVLDRAFTIELSDIDLTAWGKVNQSGASIKPWQVQAWYPRAIQLGGLNTIDDETEDIINTVIKTLTQINMFLLQAQLQVGYRTRDEVALFVLHAREILPAFVTSAGEKVDPLDLALQMKILPRIVGGNSAIRRTIVQFLGWAYNGKPLRDEQEAEPLLAAWQSTGRPDTLAKADYPRTAARLCLMWERLQNEGFTSFWL